MFAMGPHYDDRFAEPPFCCSMDSRCHAHTELPLCSVCVTLEASPMVSSAQGRQSESLASVPALVPEGLGRASVS